MYLIIQHNDDVILAKLVDRRICELRKMIREKNGECRHEFEQELSALERLAHSLHEACYDVRC